MNSEELELSLRSEFESYLKGVLAEMRQEATEFQSRIEAEFDKQKAQFDEAFQGFAARFDSERTFDAAFTSSVTEHLSLARDEGAKIAANAMVEAEKLNESAAPVVEPVPVETKYDAIRDAVADIRSKDSQSTILKALVHHAAEFAPRGAFFIIKSEHFVGWKVFGAGGETADDAIRDIHFPTSADSILGAALTENATVDGSPGSFAEDSAFLEPLEFGQPDRMHAIPLVARGRGVAVLYADYGTDGTNLNREALETLVGVAGLTVELLASMQAAKAENRAVAAADFEDAETTAAFEDANGDHAEESHETFEAVADMESESGTQFADEDESVPEYAPTADREPMEETYAAFDAPIEEMPAEPPVAAVDDEPSGFSFSDDDPFQGGFQPDAGVTNPFDAEPAPVDQLHPAEEWVETSRFTEETFEAISSGEALPDESVAAEETFDTVETFEAVETVDPAPDTFEAFKSEIEPEPEQDSGGAMVFDSGGTIESAVFESSPFEKPADIYEPAAALSGSGFVVEPVVDVPVSISLPPRLSDRPVDLPIEVPENERRIHNDARRFARLLVSEIKLYNEKKVIEGREASDLYQRLREAIDRSREMYDKRVQPPVAAKFDYFHYELVNSLADGTDTRLGAGYPGSRV